MKAHDGERMHAQVHGRLGFVLRSAGKRDLTACSSSLYILCGSMLKRRREHHAIVKEEPNMNIEPTATIGGVKTPTSKIE
jgi:hypothetical protein